MGQSRTTITHHGEMGVGDSRSHGCNAMSSVVLCVDLCGTAERDEPKCEKLTKN